MIPLVIQLQDVASRSDGSVAELLRKARMVAVKLKVDEFNEWLGHEMHGYPLDMEVPEYRRIAGDLRADNPANGVCMPIRFDAEMTERLSRFACHQSVGSIEDLIKKPKSSTLQVHFTEKQCDFVRSMLPPFERSWMIPYRRIGVSQIASILDKVRSVILDWSLELEAQGILGENMTFSNEEKQKASSQHIHIGGNFQGILGNVSDSPVTQNLNMRVETNDLESLQAVLAQMQVPHEEIARLEAAIKDDPAPKSKSEFGKNVTAWLGRQVTQISSGIYSLAINAGLSELGNAIWQYYGF